MTTYGGTQSSEHTVMQGLPKWENDFDINLLGHEMTKNLIIISLSDFLLIFAVVLLIYKIILNKIYNLRSSNHRLCFV